MTKGWVRSTLGQLGHRDRLLAAWTRCAHSQRHAEATALRAALHAELANRLFRIEGVGLGASVAV